jgi:hypothetical protein
VQVSTSNRLVATFPVEVSQPDFVLSRQEIVLGPGDSDTLRAIVPTQGNREIRNLVQWRSSDTSVVAIGAPGVVRAVSPGQADVIATGFSQERRVSVKVHQLPQALVVSPLHSGGPVQLPLRSTRRFTAAAEAADSTPIPEARILWELGDTALASFDRESCGNNHTDRATARNTTGGLDYPHHCRRHRSSACARWPCGRAPDYPGGIPQG